MANIARERTRKLREQDIKRLRRMWDAGVVSGSAGALDMKKLRCEARARLKVAGKAQPQASSARA